MKLLCKICILYMLIIFCCTWIRKLLGKWQLWKYLTIFYDISWILNKFLYFNVFYKNLHYSYFQFFNITINLLIFLSDIISSNYIDVDAAGIEANWANKNVFKFTLTVTLHLLWPFVKIYYRDTYANIHNAGYVHNTYSIRSTGYIYSSCRKFRFILMPKKLNNLLVN